MVFGLNSNVLWTVGVALPPVNDIRRCGDSAYAVREDGREPYRFSNDGVTVEEYNLSQSDFGFDDERDDFVTLWISIVVEKHNGILLSVCPVKGKPLQQDSLSVD